MVDAGMGPVAWKGGAGSVGPFGGGGYVSRSSGLATVTAGAGKV